MPGQKEKAEKEEAEKKEGEGQISAIFFRERCGFCELVFGCCFFVVELKRLFLVFLGWKAFFLKNIRHRTCFCNLGSVVDGL